jgi:hypothetical protein
LLKEKDSDKYNKYKEGSTTANNNKAGATVQNTSNLICLKLFKYCPVIHIELTINAKIKNTTK